MGNDACKCLRSDDLEKEVLVSALPVTADASKDSFSILLLFRVVPGTSGLMRIDSLTRLQPFCGPMLFLLLVRVRPGMCRFACTFT
eukprot:s2780_g5.t1